MNFTQDKEETKEWSEKTEVLNQTCSLSTLEASMLLEATNLQPRILIDLEITQTQELRLLFQSIEGGWLMTFLLKEIVLLDKEAILTHEELCRAKIQ
jgi:hypothetical protein